jgi:cyclophilin family peptidyl-prolyl cis-trans isomerase
LFFIVKKGYPMNFLKYLTLCSVVVVAVGITAAQDTPAGTPAQICAQASTAEPASREYTQAEQVLEAGVDYRAVFCTDAGAVYVDLFEDYAPATVNNFVFLAQSGYYNNLTFHRVIQDFMVQGGDPTGTGAGGPGYQFEDEFSGFLTFDRPGLLAMANAGANTNGSQFFITTAITDWLDYKHTIFGDVLEGYENVTAIPVRDPATATAPGTTLKSVVIITDASQVITTFSEDISVATQAEVNTALAVLVEEGALGGELEVADAGSKTLEEVVALAPDTLRGAYTDYLTQYGFQYREVVEVQQSACSPSLPFDLLGYRLDAFNSPENALAALNDGFLTEFYEAKGMTAVETDGSYLVFQLPAQTCSNQEGLIQVLIIPRGRYLATINGLFSKALTDQLTPKDLMVNKITPIFEGQLVGAFRSELR